jgi:SAM-dependent methyltransferase
MAGFDAAHMAAFFDEYGDREWDRHDATPGARVSFELHCDALDRFVRSGDLVLDAGSGPGRFTIELARRGARVHAGDLSEGQLDQHRRRVGAAGCEGAVVARERLDVCDLSHLADRAFDAAVCFGGPLSYVRGRSAEALAELARVTRPGGHVLLSVMSAAGAMRAFLPAVLDEHRRYGPEHIAEVLASGDLDRDTNDGHEMHLFTWAELAALCAPHGEVVAASAANFLTAGPPAGALDGIDDDEWQALLSWERRLCREPGALDGGTHILAVLRVP